MLLYTDFSVARDDPMSLSRQGRTDTSYYSRNALFSAAPLNLISLLGHDWLSVRGAPSRTVARPVPIQQYSFCPTLERLYNGPLRPVGFVGLTVVSSCRICRRTWTHRAAKLPGAGLRSCFPVRADENLAARNAMVCKNSPVTNRSDLTMKTAMPCRLA